MESMESLNKQSQADLIEHDYGVMAAFLESQSSMIKTKLELVHYENEYVPHCTYKQSNSESSECILNFSNNTVLKGSKKMSKQLDVSVKTENSLNKSDIEKCAKVVNGDWKIKNEKLNLKKTGLPEDEITFIDCDSQEMEVLKTENSNTIDENEKWPKVAYDDLKIKIEEVNLKEEPLLENEIKQPTKVSDLQKLVFSSLSLSEKLDLKNTGRPLPILNIVQVQSKCKSKAQFSRKFNKEIYNKIFWICGCEDRNSFFCFVCLLFGGDDNWTKNGLQDLKHLSGNIKKHKNSAKHRHNVVSFQMLGQTNILTCLSSAYADGIKIHNEKVKKNRHVLSKIIDILKFCGNCNLSLRGYNEKDDSVNKGVFLELVDFSAQIDPLLHSHIQEATVFKGTLKTIQNELLECMLKVCQENILEEIRKSSFVAVLVDDTTDVSTQTQTVIVFRYELNGKIFERFWGFENPESQDAEGLFQCILKHIEPILKDCPEKLIAQTYDGAAVMRGHVGGVNVKIKELYKNAHFIYCYAHQLNKLLEQASSSIPSVRIFFANLNGISAFFSRSPDRSAALSDVSTRRIPRPSETRWDSNSRIVQSVFQSKDDLLECFKNIILGISKKYNTETVAQAAGFINWLNDENFLFWLNFFNKIMPHVDILFNQLQAIQTDAVKIQIAIDNFEKEILNIRNSLPPGITDADGLVQNTSEVPKKRRKLNEENLDLSAREVCDIITSEVKSRFGFKNHLSGAKLFIRKNYKNYSNSLPLEDINIFCAAYPMINKEILIMELEVFYSRTEITDIGSEDGSENENVFGCLKTLNFLITYGLDSAFPEIVKVLKLLVTIPMTTSETDRCFSTLKLIKTFLRNSMDEDRLTALAMLSIEKAMVRDIDNFNNKVIEKFVFEKKYEDLTFTSKNNIC